MGTKTVSRTWVGSGVAAIALLTIVQSQLGDLNLQTLVKWLLIFGLGVLIALITAYSGARSARKATQEEEAALQDALAGNLRRVSDRNPFDLGARPGPPGYTGRTIDHHLDDALAHDAEGNEAMVLLTGPAGAGKTRSAYQAIERTHPNAILLAPVDGPAVGTLLSQRRKLGLDSSKRAVLWLDSLERYFEKLDLDALDELLFPEDTLSALKPIRRSSTRAWRAVRRFAKSLRPRKSAIALTRDTSRNVAVVATIRDDELEAALTGDDATAQTARRLTARMRIVPVPARPGPAPAGVLPGVANFEPPVFQAPPAPTDGRGLLTVLAVGLVLLALGVWAAVEREGWKVPPSLASQTEDVENELDACQHFSESPDVKALHKKSPWILAVSNRDCPGSDTVRYFSVSENKRLEEVFSESPQSTERWEFICLAPGGNGLQCRTPVTGVGDVTLGAFRNAPKKLQLPLVLYQSAGQTWLYAPFLSPPARRLAQGGGGQIMTLKLHRGAAYSPEPRAPRPSCQRPAQLCGPGLEFLTALPRANERPLLILGTVTKGTVTNPRRVSLRAFALESANARVRVDPRECLFFRKGTQVSGRKAINVKAPADTAEQVRKYWNTERGENEAVVC
jgi:hypothetical protein